MTAFKKLSGVSFVKSPRDQKSDVVDHVGVCEVVHEFGEGADCVRSKVAELGDHLVRGSPGQGRGGWIRWERGKEVTIGWGELEFKICGNVSILFGLQDIVGGQEHTIDGLTLRKVGIVLCGQQTVPISSNYPLDVAGLSLAPWQGTGRNKGVKKQIYIPILNIIE